MFSMKCLCTFLALLSIAVALRPKPPQIINPSGNKWSNPIVILRDGTGDVFECAAQGVPTPTYKWFLNGTEISDRQSDNMQVDPITGRLTLTDFRPLFSGMYQCVAENENGAAMTPYLHILCTVIGRFEGTVVTEDRTIGPSLYKNLTCENVPYSIPALKIKWGTGQEVRNAVTNEIEYENVKDIVDSERFITDADGTLHILWVDATKDTDRSFRCVGDNDILSLKSTKVYKLKIQPGLENFRKPELKYNKDVVVMEGRNAELKCVFTYFKTNPREHFEVTWLHQGNEVGMVSDTSDNSIYEKNKNNPGILFVKNVQIPDGKNIDVEGEYLCLATLGSHEAQGKVHLTVVAPPKFIPNGGLRSLSAPKSKDATFSCFTYSHNAYEDPVTWFVNGRPILGCPMGMFECETPNNDGSPQCISLQMKGDSYPDCNGVSEETSSMSCNEAQKVCNNQCIDKETKCVEAVCDFSNFKCSDGRCILATQVCNNHNDCADIADEQFCPGLPPLLVGPDRRLIVTSNRRELTVPSIRRDDSMCVQCMVRNVHGVLFGDGCLTVIDNIDATLLPNSSYMVGPGDRLNIGVDATTDPLYQNQMKYSWLLYDVEDDSIAYNVGHGLYKDQFTVSLTGKNLTINFPDVVGDADEQLRLYNIYDGMTDRKYALHISHRFDEFIFNFTVDGQEVVKPKPVPIIQASTNLWFIAVILAIILLFVVIALIICYLHRNRGGTYLLDKKEHQAGHDPEQELKDSGFQDVGRVDDYDDDEKQKLDEVSLTESVKPYESDEDITEEYGGDFDISKFNEDGSFIGLYGDKKSKSNHKEATV